MDLLSNVRHDIAKFVGESGVCEDDPRTLDSINDARRILYPLGDWENTVEYVCVKCQEGRFTLPPQYEYAKTAYNCLKHIVVENDWFTRIDGTLSEYCGAKNGNIVKENGRFVTFREWPRFTHGCKTAHCGPEGFRLEIVFESDHDCGVELFFRGHGAVRREVSLTRVLSGQPFLPVLPAPTDDRFISLTQVIKPRTEGRIRLYGVDGANKILLALYDPDDVNPTYTRYRHNTSWQSFQSIIIKCKKRFLRYGDDPNILVDIHTDALIAMAQALTSREARDQNGFAQNVTLATGFLNKQLAGEQSTSTSPIHWSKAMRVTNLVE